MNEKKEKISQKSVKREIKTGRKKIKHELHCGILISRFKEIKLLFLILNVLQYRD